MAGATSLDTLQYRQGAIGSVVVMIPGSGQTGRNGWESVGVGLRGWGQMRNSCWCPQDCAELGLVFSLQKCILCLSEDTGKKVETD